MHLRSLPEIQPRAWKCVVEKTLNSKFANLELKLFEKRLIRLKRENTLELKRVRVCFEKHNSLLLAVRCGSSAL